MSQAKTVIFIRSLIMNGWNFVKIYYLKWNEKLLMRLNPRCPELRGAANPNQARLSFVRLTFQFVDPACRDTEDLGWKGLVEI